MANAQIAIQLKADPEFHAMLAVAHVESMAAIAAANALNEIRHNFTRARLRLGVDRLTPNDLDATHGEAFRQAIRLQLLRVPVAIQLLDIVAVVAREKNHA